MANAADQAKLKKRLESLLKLPENQVCADCKKRGPRWASANLGIFFCIECSGIHRNLGVHISFVRSVNLDSWTKAQVDFMEEWGNKRANEYYEANIPPNVHRPKEGDPVRVVEKFIRDKYEFKRYIAKSVPPKVVREEETEDVDEDAPKRRTASSKAKVSTPVTARPTPAAVAAPAKPVEAPSLIDFMDDPLPPAPQPQQQPQFAPPTAASNDWGNFATAPAASQPPQQQQQQQQAFAGGFGSFESAPAPAPTQDIFASFGSQPAAPAPAPKPQASADAILSLYGGPPQQHQHGMSGGYGAPQGGGSMGGWGAPQQFHQQPPAGMMMGYHQPPPPMMGPSGGYPGQQQHVQQPHMGMAPMQAHPAGFGGPGYNPSAQPMGGMGGIPNGGMGAMNGGFPQQQGMGGYPPQQPPVNPFGNMGGYQQPAQGGYPPVNPFQQQQYQQQHQQQQQQQQYPFPNGFGAR